MITLLLRQSGAALRMLLVATVVLGLVYPLAVWGVARLPGLHGPAEGSVVTAPDGTPPGSSLIGIDPVAGRPGRRPVLPHPPVGVRAGRPRPRRPVDLRRLEPGRVLRQAARPGRAAPGRDRRPRGRRARGRAGRRGHRVRLRPRPAHQPGVRRPAGRPGRPGHRPAGGAGPRARRGGTPTGASLGFLGEPGVERHPAEPRHRRRRAATDGRMMEPWAARAASCGSTSARRPGSARPTPCSARPTAAPSAAPTSSSGWSRPTAGPRPAKMLDGLEVVPRRTVVLPRRRA